MNKDLSYYRQLPYRRRVEPREEQGQVFFFAWVEEISWITADGATREEALHILGENFEDAIEALIALGDEIAEPVTWPASFPGSETVAHQAELELHVPRRAAAGQEMDWETPEHVAPWTPAGHSPDVRLVGADA